MARYWTGTGTFIPEATGQVLDPLAMDPAQADALMGAELMAAIRAASERVKERPMQYVQIVRVPKPDPHAELIRREVRG